MPYNTPVQLAQDLHCNWHSFSTPRSFNAVLASLSNRTLKTDAWKPQPWYCKNLNVYKVSIPCHLCTLLYLNSHLKFPTQHLDLPAAHVWEMLCFAFKLLPAGLSALSGSLQVQGSVWGVHLWPWLLCWWIVLILPTLIMSVSTTNKANQKHSWAHKSKHTWLCIRGQRPELFSFLFKAILTLGCISFPVNTFYFHSL